MDLIGLKCLYFLILSSVVAIQVIAIEDNPVSLQLKDPSSLSSPATKNKFQTFSETFKQSITKLKKNHKKIDLVFLVDSSSSVGKVNFLSEIKFVKKVLADFTVSYNHTRVAVVTFSSALSVVRHIDQITSAKKENDKCTLINTDVPKIQFIGGGTFTYGALLEAQKIFESARKQSKKVIVLITDGFSNGKDPIPLALKLKEDNVTIFSVGIENGNQEELYSVSSLPQKDHSFLMESFSQFESLARKALHFDFRVGTYLSTSDETLCHKLCDLEANSTTCCDLNAECSCGITTGQYTCMCSPGYYGSGLVNNCAPCPNGTYWATWNLCKPCPDINHVSSGDLTTGLDACKCKSGFKSVAKNRCEIIRCPKLMPPENGYFVHPDSSEAGCDNVLNAACGARCLSGYQLIGSSIRLCQENGTWSGSETECSLKRCPALPIPFYGMAICKNPDLDLFFDYSPRNLTFLAHFDNEELRITQPMPIDTDCAFKCGHGFALVGSSSRVCLPLSKWDGLQTICKQILCPALPNIPFGVYEPADCEGSKSGLGTNCSISCMEGFLLKGPSAKTCNGKRIGVWSNKNKHSKCIDVQAPNITCPRNYNISMEANETYALLMELQQPVVQDNSELNVTVSTTPVLSKEGTRLFKGRHNFTFSAVDTFANEASCNVTVNVVDTTPPVWENCIDPDTIKIRPDKPFVEWDEPVAYDNDNETVRVVASLQPGVELPAGVHQVNYTAFDSSNNTNLCVMNITVAESKCHPLESPKNGTSICASNATTVWCSLNCQPGFEVYFEESTSAQEMITIECQHKDPSWKYEAWPDCEPIELPDSVEELFHFDLDVDEEFCNVDKDNQSSLIAAIKLQLCGDQENCTIVSDLPTCEEILGSRSAIGGDDENNSTAKDLEGAVYHTMVRRRRNLLALEGQVAATPKPLRRSRPKGKLAIKINIYTRLSKKLGIWSQNVTRSENLKRIQYELEHLHENPQLQHRLSDLRVDVDRLQVNVNTTCQLGRVAKKNICVKCPRGMFHHFVSNKCVPCSLGTYAENTGQLDCQKCPEYHTTRRVSSQTISECLQMCPPGTIARIRTPKNPHHPQKQIKSLMPYCKKCPPNEYQPDYDQTSCLRCPDHHYSPRGSKSISDCLPKPIHPCDITGTCKNNGQCFPSPTNPSLFTCSCLEGFTGSYCENRLDHCLSAPCENGAVCRHLPGEQMTCTCPPGFTGKLCEIVKNPCRVDSCQNNGECLEVEGEVLCDCPFGYYGDRCEFKKDFCTPNPCQAGTCFSAFNSYLCQCPPGVMGKRCHLTPCDYLPCPKGKLCTNLPHLPANVSSFACKCPIGFRGENCDQVDNPCERNACRNNGICRPTLLSRGPEFDSRLYDKFTCQCPIYFYGDTCEHLVTPDFVLEFPNSQITHLVKIKGPAKDLTEFSICSWIETKDKQNYGTILSYATELVDNMITLTDYNGLTLYVNGSHVTSDIVLNDGRWHFLCVMWESQRGHFEMIVDGQMKFAGDDLAKGEVILANGVLVLGQEQDEIGGSFSASETFLGKLAYFDVWDRMLQLEEIHEFFSTCEPYHGSLYVWTDFKLKIEGDVRVLSSPFCKECPKDISVANGKIQFINNNAIYQCDEGFYVHPMAIRQCLRTAMWQEPAPVCRAKTCPQIDRPANMKIVVTRYTAGGSVTYTCDEHFTMQGRNKRICLSSGNWSGEVPRCTSDINCPALTAREGMTISYSSEKEELPQSNSDYPIGTFAQIECSESGMEGITAEFICSEDGEWDGDLPICERTSTTMESQTTTQIITSTVGQLKPSSTTEISSTTMQTSRRTDSFPTTIPTDRPRQHPAGSVPEYFWIEMRHYLYHGCQSETYRSVLCKVSKLSRFSDLSQEAPKIGIQMMEKKVQDLLEDELRSADVSSLTIDSLYEDVIKGASIPEDSLRQFLSFSIDNIVWNFHNLETYLEDNELAIALIRIMEPIFNNFQANYDIEEVFSSVKTSTQEMIPETTTKLEKTCSMSKLPQLPNGIHELIDGRPVYRCKDSFKMTGEFEVNCGVDGQWEVSKNGNCQRKCGILQIPEVMKPQSLQSLMMEDTVKLECVRGYEFHGRPNVKCLPTGVWSKINGMCAKISCNKPKRGSLVDGKSYLYMDRVKVKCNDGQIHELQCQANGSWSPNILRC